MQTSNTQDPTARDYLGRELPDLITSVEVAIQDLVREAEHISERYNGFTYASGPGAKRPANEWSHLAAQIQVAKGGGRFYIYWRHFKATIRAGGRKIRLSSQVSMPAGRMTYRPETLISRSQPWEREELLRTEAEFAAIRRRAKQLAELLSLLTEIQKAPQERVQ